MKVHRRSIFTIEFEPSDTAADLKRVLETLIPITAKPHRELDENGYYDDDKPLQFLDEGTQVPMHPPGRD